MHDHQVHDIYLLCRLYLDHVKSSKRFKSLNTIKGKRTHAHTLIHIIIVAFATILYRFWDRLKVANEKIRMTNRTKQSDEISKIKRSIRTSEWHTKTDICQLVQRIIWCFLFHIFVSSFFVAAFAFGWLTTLVWCTQYSHFCSHIAHSIGICDFGLCFVFFFLFDEYATEHDLRNSSYSNSNNWHKNTCAELQSIHYANVQNIYAFSLARFVPFQYHFCMRASISKRE